jgi:hypothetical protein
MPSSEGDQHDATRGPTPDRADRRRGRRAFLVAAILAGGLVLAVFVAPIERARALTELISAVAWPLGITLALLLFWPQIQVVVREIVRRAESGDPVELGPVNLPALARRIPTPAADANVSLANIALLHTSFVRRDKSDEFSDGRTYFQIEAVVVAPPDVMQRIDSVVYHLDEAWPARSRNPERRNPGDRFKLKELANGTSILRATVNFKSGQQALELNRFIDLRPDGPRL